MTNTLFDHEENTSVFDPNKNWEAELVGEGKKFKTHADLARAKAESDSFIETMKKEQAELRAEYNRVLDESRAQAKLSDFLDRIEKRKDDTSNVDNNANETNKPPVDPEDIEKMISDRLTKVETSRKEQSNLSAVQEKLKDRFGDNMPNVLKETMSRLGLSKEDVDNIARKSPDAIFSMFGLNQQTGDSFSAPTRSSLRSDLSSTNTKKRDWNFYQQLKRSDPKEYFSPKTKIQMHKDAQEMGEAFYGSNSL